MQGIRRPPVSYAVHVADVICRIVLQYRHGVVPHAMRKQQRSFLKALHAPIAPRAAQLTMLPCDKSDHG